MPNETQRAAIKKHYRTLRIAVDKTQLEVQTAAKLDEGKYWKIENGFVFPTDDERKAIARALKVNAAELPAEQLEEKAS